MGDAFQWAKRHAWVEWERKHTIGGLRVIEDRTMNPGTVRITNNRQPVRSLLMYNTGDRPGDWSNTHIIEVDS